MLTTLQIKFPIGEKVDLIVSNLASISKYIFPIITLNSSFIKSSNFFTISEVSKSSCKFFVTYFNSLLRLNE